MKRAAIVCPIRTPVGKFLGTLAPITAGDLGAVILTALVERTGIDPERIDDVIFAQGIRQRRGPCIAPLERAGGGAADQRAGLSARPALRQRAAGA